MFGEIFKQVQLPLRNITAIANDGAPAMVGRNRVFFLFLNERCLLYIQFTVTDTGSILQLKNRVANDMKLYNCASNQLIKLYLILLMPDCLQSYVAI